MSRRLAELDRMDLHSEMAGTAPVQRRRGLGRSGLLYLLSVAAIAGVLSALGYFFPNLIAPWSDDGSRTRAPSSGATGPYAFMNTTPAGRPVSYDPCREIPYVVNPEGLPAAGMRLTHEAVEEISRATGLRFVDLGVTEERPDPERGISDSSGAGGEWPPLLIAWATVTEYPMVGEDVDGVGGSTSVAPDGPESARYVTGQVVLDRDAMAELAAEADGDIRARAIIVHELGHVVGLGHVDDPGELMVPTYTGLTGLGPGDRQGLAQLGAGPCWPDM